MFAVALPIRPNGASESLERVLLNSGHASPKIRRTVLSRGGVHGCDAEPLRCGLVQRKLR
jgi:hypothetical protein